MKTRRASSTTVCEACESRRALRPQPERIPDDPYQLCQRCSDRVERLSLRPLEWYNLAKRHSPNGPALSADYYSPGGAALMSEDAPEEEPHVLPAPALKEICHDLDLLWDHTLTRRELKPKLVAAWCRHLRAKVAARLTQAWVSRQDDHARGHVLTLCRDCLGRAGAELARSAWKDYNQYLQAPFTTRSAEIDVDVDGIDFSRLIDRHLPDSDDDDHDDDDDSSVQMFRRSFRYDDVKWHSLLPSLSARCLPRDEAYQLVQAEVERCGYSGWFTALGDPRVLDWIETHIRPPLTSDWGRVAASCGFSWDRAIRWLQQGRPLSHAALDALDTLIFPLGDPDDRDHGPRLLSPPNRRTLSRVLKAHALRDPVPRVEKSVAFILHHASVLLEGKPYV